MINIIRNNIGGRWPVPLGGHITVNTNSASTGQSFYHLLENVKRKTWKIHHHMTFFINFGKKLEFTTP